MMGLVFYDLDSIDKRSWSSNTLKTKLAIAHKGLDKLPDYGHEFIAFPDIAKVLSGKGATPIPGHPTGYTVPALEHDGKILMDSWAIANYLEATFPDHGPTLFPKHSRPLARMLKTIPGGGSVHHFLLNGILKRLDERSANAYIANVQLRAGGKAITDIARSDDDEEGIKQALQSTVADWKMLEDMLSYNDDGPFLLGKERSYADIQLVAVFHAARIASSRVFDCVSAAAPRLRQLYDACSDILEPRKDMCYA